MEMKIVFDTYSHRKELHTGWGVSLLFDGHLLFDTGERGDWLIHNMHQMHIEPSDIKTVVISHDHWDHTGGLDALLKIAPNCVVYGCPGFSTGFRTTVASHEIQLHEPRSLTKITDYLYTTGEITGTYKNAPISEQALVVQKSNDIFVITGCAHPGITEIVRMVRDAFPTHRLRLVAGGFHLMHDSDETIFRVMNQLRELGAHRLAPTHCSGDNAARICRNVFGDAYLPLSVGESITLD